MRALARAISIHWRETTETEPKLELGAVRLPGVGSDARDTTRQLPPAKPVGDWAAASEASEEVRTAMRSKLKSVGLCRRMESSERRRVSSKDYQGEFRAEARVAAQHRA